VPNPGACHRGAKPGYQKTGPIQVLCGGILFGVKFRQNMKNKNRKGLFYHNIPIFLKKIVKF
jgi:hypothetical protein